MSEVKLVAKPGEVEFSRGMAGVIARESTKSLVVGEEGKLYYYGYSIEDLAEQSSYEEVAYLLLNDRLPNEEELVAFKKRLVAYREIPLPVYDLIVDQSQHYNIHPMSLLRTAVSMMADFDEVAEDEAWDAQQRVAMKLIARLPTVAAAIGRARQGLEPIQPRPDLSHAANFLYMLLGEEPDELLTKIMDVILITHADHGCNASTFTALVVESTLSDMYSVVVAGIGALKGPLHGGANQRVMEMLAEIGSVENAEAWIADALARKKKVMGFGHRVYKAMDPRAVILKEYAKEITKRAGTEDWLRIAEVIERAMIEKVGGKGIWPNVDFFSGVVMSSMGIDTDLFTVIFAVSRVAGWVAHALEQRADNRIYRPRFVYTGPEPQPYVPLNER
ncbi:MAG: citrate/2-methylcitrate synthase [Anaerolineae bacterium]